MAVVVMFSQGAVEVIKDGLGWSIDVYGDLEVYKENDGSGRLATFARGTWLFAKQAEAKGEHA